MMQFFGQFFPTKMAELSFLPSLSLCDAVRIDWWLRVLQSHTHFAAKVVAIKLNEAGCYPVLPLYCDWWLITKKSSWLGCHMAPKQPSSRPLSWHQLKLCSDWWFPTSSIHVSPVVILQRNNALPPSLNDNCDVPRSGRILLVWQLTVEIWYALSLLM